MWNLQPTVFVLVVVAGFVWTQNPDCDYVIKLQPGSTSIVSNDNYPYNYTPGDQCRWILQCPSGYNCKVNCSDINIPKTSSCAMDRLQISKSGDPQLNAADYYCGGEPVTAVSTGQVLSVGLKTSYNSPGGAFYCQASAVQASTPPCSCGYKKMTRIVGGHITGINEYPSMVGIADRKTEQITCGGVIISKRYTLTAAHCVKEKQAADMAVVVGEHDVNNDDSPATSVIGIESYSVHPRFNVESLDNYDYDIALIRVTEDIAFGPLVGPVCLPFRYTNMDMTGKQLTALGWGVLFPGGPTSSVLMKVDLDVISRSECLKDIPQLTARQFCTYTPGKDACQYDSGGPLLYTDPSSGKLYIMGILSYGEACASTSPGINTRVTDFLDWIVDSTPDADYCRP